jgi:hypothetical protein
MQKILAKMSGPEASPHSTAKPQPNPELPAKDARRKGELS